jgi:hypothetical protein
MRASAPVRNADPPSTRSSAGHEQAEALCVQSREDSADLIQKSMAQRRFAEQTTSLGELYDTDP